VVHHVNGDTYNNQNRNLVICQDDAYHVLLHTRAKALAACGHADWLKCCCCKQYGSPDDVRYGRHRACAARYARQRRARAKAAQA
jgi:hypothetical protein